MGFLHEWAGLSGIIRNTGEHAMEIAKRLPNE